MALAIWPDSRGQTSGGAQKWGLQTWAAACLHEKAMIALACASFGLRLRARVSTRARFMRQAGGAQQQQRRRGHNRRSTRQFPEGGETTHKPGPLSGGGRARSCARINEMGANKLSVQMVACRRRWRKPNSCPSQRPANWLGPVDVLARRALFVGARACRDGGARWPAASSVGAFVPILGLLVTGPLPGSTTTIDSDLATSDGAARKEAGQAGGRAGRKDRWAARE